jgi:prolipoprotein diacylglyceryltransferase
MLSHILAPGAFPAGHTVLWALGLTLAAAWTRRRATVRFGLPDGPVRAVLLSGLVGMLFFARMGDAVVNLMGPPDSLHPWGGWGLSAIPAILGGAVCTLFTAGQDEAFSLPLFGEAAAPPLFLLLAVGRPGCFLAGCCAGIPADLPWGVHFAADAPGVFRHPTQIYEALFALAMLGVFLFLERRAWKGLEHPPELLWGTALAAYGAWRLGNCGLRSEGDPWMGAFLAIVLMIAGMAWLLRGEVLERKRRERGTGGARLDLRRCP